MNNTKEFNLKIIKRLQDEAKLFLTTKNLIMEGIVIIPKEIEVYYYKEKEFEDDSVHRNELQKNHRNHFYIHRRGKKNQDAYKGGNRAGIDFIISGDNNVYYSYLIRSAVINGQLVVGPHKVLVEIKSASNLRYTDIENKEVVLASNNTSDDVVLFSKRINLGKNVSEDFLNYRLRAVLCDELFSGSKYPKKEEMIINYVLGQEMTNEQASYYAKKHLGYIPSSIKNL